jgi:hypothetical protein
MVCTKETYTATATWTPVQLADVFREAFIDAGLMTNWYSSFANGTREHRILEVTHDPTKTWGKSYYWFVFSTVNSLAGLSFCSGWNNVTNVPTGTLYLDHSSTATNTEVQHYGFMGTLAQGNTFQLVRYTSQINPNVSWFMAKHGTVRKTFTIANENNQVRNWVNLDRGVFQGYSHVVSSTSAGMGFVNFNTGPGIRREIIRGCGLAGSTNVADYVNTMPVQKNIGYAAVGNTSALINNFNRGQADTFLPVGFSATNPSYPSNSSPVFSGLTYNPYLQGNLPEDFGVSFHYATNSFATEDTLVVSSGTEEWEVLDFAANASAVTGASPLFLARMV